MEITKIMYFITASVMLTLAPGPDIIFVIIQSISQGKKAGIATALGLCTGILVHTTAAALGISIIIHQSAIAFKAIKYAGAVYLLYLAFKAYKEKDETISIQSIKNKNTINLYKRGIFMNILNPKVSIFFLAFLPQFVTYETGNVSIQMIVLGIIFMIQAIVIFSIIAVFSGAFGNKLLNNPKLVEKINLVKAAVFGIIGIRLAFIEK